MAQPERGPYAAPPTARTDTREPPKPGAPPAAGKPYEFARLAGENHNITFQSTRIKTLQAMDAFLAKHNPAR